MFFFCLFWHCPFSYFKGEGLKGKTSHLVKETFQFSFTGGSRSIWVKFKNFIIFFRLFRFNFSEILLGGNQGLRSSFIEGSFQFSFSFVQVHLIKVFNFFKISFLPFAVLFICISGNWKEAPLSSSGIFRFQFSINYRSI